MISVLRLPVGISHCAPSHWYWFINNSLTILATFLNKQCKICKRYVPSRYSAYTIHRKYAHNSFLKNIIISLYKSLSGFSFLPQMTNSSHSLRTICMQYGHNICHSSLPFFSPHKYPLPLFTQIKTFKRARNKGQRSQSNATFIMPFLTGSFTFLSSELLKH